jgi:uncharacterized SAM-binding protein YcdF (DUF218 family)
MSVLILSLPLTANTLIRRLEIFPPLADSALAPIVRDEPTAIVVLAAGRRIFASEFDGSLAHESVDALTLERLRYAAYVAKRTNLPLLVSGGIPDHGYALAELMAEVLSHDYNVAAKWREIRSTNTAENAIFSSQILKRQGITRVLLVTHAWHMKRARAAFLANGMKVVAAPTAFEGMGDFATPSDLIPGVGALRMSSYALHEMIGAVWYEARYKY